LILGCQVPLLLSSVKRILFSKPSPCSLNGPPPSFHPGVDTWLSLSLHFPDHHVWIMDRHTTQVDQYYLHFCEILRKEVWSCILIILKKGGETKQNSKLKTIPKKNKNRKAQVEGGRGERWQEKSSLWELLSHVQCCSGTLFSAVWPVFLLRLFLLIFLLVSSHQILPNSVYECQISTVLSKFLPIIEILKHTKSEWILCNIILHKKFLLVKYIWTIP
jgi:hypothetical protein